MTGLHRTCCGSGQGAFRLWGAKYSEFNEGLQRAGGEDGIGPRSTMGGEATKGGMRNGCRSQLARETVGGIQTDRRHSDPSACSLSAM